MTYTDQNCNNSAEFSAASDAQPNNQAALKFLREFHPDGDWTLTRIPVDGTGIETVTFDPNTEEECIVWLERWNGTQNLYFAINPTRLKDKKSKEADVTHLSWLHVDIDAEATGDLEAAKAVLLERITTERPESVPEPTCIWMSGGGYWAAWRLENPAPTGNDMLGSNDEGLEKEVLARIENLKLYNIGMEEKLGGDHCFNLDRIARLPGTVNIPDDKKMAKGRQRALASVLHFSDKTYSLSDFEKGTAKLSNDTEVAPLYVDFSSLPSGDLITQLPDGIPEWCIEVIHHGKRSDDPGRYISRSEAQHAVSCELARYKCPDDLHAAILLDSSLMISTRFLEKGNSAERVVLREIQRAKTKVSEGNRILSKDDPYSWAKKYVAEMRPNIMYHNGEYLDYNDVHYYAEERETIRAELWAYLSVSKCLKTVGGEKKLLPFKPSKGNVDAFLDALKGLIHKSVESCSPPCFLEHSEVHVWCDPKDILPCTNGLLHIPSLTLLPHTPAFFTRNGLDYSYDANADEPAEWLKFQDDIWQGDADKTNLNQEIFGYLLLPDTSQQKIPLYVGPPRSGKGTQIKVMTKLVGGGNVGHPKMGSLGKEFGLQPLIGKQIAFISDARLPRGSGAATVETLLSISGEDSQSIPRKYNSNWEGKMPVRFVIMSNEVPDLKETSGALANRYIPMRMNKSFLGHEDIDLDQKLSSEMPGILNWAIRGLQRLRSRGRFALPQSVSDEVLNIQSQSDSVQQFIADECEFDPDATIDKERLFLKYNIWCEQEGRTHKLHKSKFFEKLVTAGNGQLNTAYRPRSDDGGPRPRVVKGLRLAEAEAVMPF